MPSGFGRVGSLGFQGVGFSMDLAIDWTRLSRHMDEAKGLTSRSLQSVSSRLWSRFVSNSLRPLLGQVRRELWQAVGYDCP